MRWREWPLMEEVEDPGKGGESELPEKEEGKSIPIDVLPEDLQGRSPAEIKFLLGRMSESLVNSNATSKDLKERLAQLEESVKNPPKPKEPDPDDDISDEELIVKNPEKAISRILERKGVTKQFENLGSQVSEATFSLVGSKIPDFNEYEEDVRNILKSSKSPVDEAHILGALKMAVGDRFLADKAKNARKSGSLETPKDDESLGKPKFGELSGIEKEIFDASGLSREDYERYKTDEYMEVKVPS